VLRTAQGAGDATGAELGASLTGYILTYIVLFIAYIVVLTHMAGEGAREEPAPTSWPATAPVASGER
jgi:cytochrome bd ubiquinol oxidase subunit I